MDGRTVRVAHSYKGGASALVDGVVAWTLTRFFNALAARSPASILRVDAETAALKVAAYEGMWQAAGPL